MSSVVPDGWELTTLNSNASLITDGSHFSPLTAEDGKPIATVKNMNSRHIDVASCRLISEEDFNELVKGNSSPCINDVLFSKDGTVGKTFVYRQKDQIVLLSSIAIIRLYQDKLVPEYCTQYLQSPFFYQTLENTKSGSAIRRIVLKDIKQLTIPKPPLPEQQKIATILSSVDDVIELTQAQIDKLKDLKTGMMQELLTKGIGHTEFKDSPVGKIPAGWDVKRLNELVTIKHGYAFEGEYFRTSKTNHILLTPGNFNRDGRLYFGPKTKYYEGPIPDGYILENGDVLVVMTDLTKEMTILGNTIILQSPSVVLHNQRIGKVEPVEDDVVTTEFLCLVLNSDRVKTHVKDTATGTTVRHSSPTKILEPLVPVPSLIEQEKIMSIFSSVDDRLAIGESKLVSSQNIKKALMQDLLTGKVRVSVN